MTDVVNISSPNDNAGDVLRTGFQKINAEFASIRASFNYRGVWATGVVYNADTRDYFLNAGLYYVTNITHTAGVFATDFAAGRFSEVDLIALQNNLAGTGLGQGSELIGHLPTWASAIGMTLRKWLGIGKPDILMFIPFSEWPAIVARTSTYNCTPAMLAAAATGKPFTIYTKGKYYFTTNVVSTTDFDLDMAAGVELDFRAVTGIAIDVSGAEPLAIPDLGANITESDTVVQFASAPPLVAGDWFWVYNPTPSSYSAWRTNYNAGALRQVHSVSGNFVTVLDPYYQDYLVADIDCYKMTSVIARISGQGKIYCGNHNGQGVRFSLCANTFMAFEFDGDVDTATSFFRTANAESHVFGTNRGNSSGVGAVNNYLVGFFNSYHSRHYGHGRRSYAQRHVVTTGGGAGLCNIPVEDIIGFDENARCAGDSYALDFHGNTIKGKYIGGSTHNCTLQGKDNGYYGMTIYAADYGVCVDYAEVVGGDLGCYDCTYVCNIDPQPSGRGVIDVGGNDTSSVTANTTEPVRITITGDAYLSNLTASTSFFEYNNRGTTQRVDIKIAVDFKEVNALGQLLFTQLISGTVDANSKIDLSGCQNLPSGVLQHNANAGAYTVCKHRGITQTGVYSGTTTATTSVIAGPINFTNAFPKVPTYTDTSLTGVSGAALGNLAGQVAVVARPFSVTGAQIRPMVGAFAAFTAGSTYEQPWRAILAEF